MRGAKSIDVWERSSAASFPKQVQVVTPKIDEPKIATRDADRNEDTRARNCHQTSIRSTSSSVTSSARQSWVVRVEAWFAIAAAFSNVPPFLR